MPAVYLVSLNIFGNLFTFLLMKTQTNVTFAQMILFQTLTKKQNKKITFTRASLYYSLCKYCLLDKMSLLNKVK